MLNCQTVGPPLHLLLLLSLLVGASLPGPAAADPITQLLTSWDEKKLARGLDRLEGLHGRKCGEPEALLPYVNPLVEGFRQARDDPKLASPALRLLDAIVLPDGRTALESTLDDERLCRTITKSIVQYGPPRWDQATLAYDYVLRQGCYDAEGFLAEGLGDRHRYADLLAIAPDLVTFLERYEWLLPATFAAMSEDTRAMANTRLLVAIADQLLAPQLTRALEGLDEELRAIDREIAGLEGRLACRDGRGRAVEQEQQALAEATRRRAELLDGREPAVREALSAVDPAILAVASHGLGLSAGIRDPGTKRAASAGSLAGLGLRSGLGAEVWLRIVAESVEAPVERRPGDLERLRVHPLDYTAERLEPSSRAVLGLTLGLGKGQGCALGWDGLLRCWGMTHTPLGVPPRGRHVALDGRCALSLDGRARCWPRAAEKDFFDRVWPRPRGPLDGLAQGWGGMCGIRSDGTLEIPQFEHPKEPDELAGGTWQAAAVSGRYGCGLAPDGSIRCWGCQSVAQADHPRPCQVPEGRFVQLRAGRSSEHFPATFCARDEVGDLSCWGGDDELPWERVEGPFIDFDFDRRTGCGVQVDGSVRCWGKGPVIEQLPSLKDAARVFVRDQVACAALQDGTLSCWGLPSYSVDVPPADLQLRGQVTPPRSTPGAPFDVRRWLEGQAWAWAQRTAGEHGLLAYLEAHPEGRFRQQAEDSLRSLRFDRAFRGRSRADGDATLEAYPDDPRARELLADMFGRSSRAKEYLPWLEERRRLTTAVDLIAEMARRAADEEIRVVARGECPRCGGRVLPARSTFLAHLRRTTRWKLVEADEPGPGLTLEVEVNGGATSAQYAERPWAVAHGLEQSTTLYTGAHVQVDVRLLHDGVVLLQNRGDGRIDERDKVSSGRAGTFRNPRNAPLTQAFDEADLPGTTDALIGRMEELLNVRVGR